MSSNEQSTASRVGYYARKFKKAISLLFTEPTMFIQTLKPYFLKPDRELIQIGDVTFRIDPELSDPSVKMMFFKLYQVDTIKCFQSIVRQGDTCIDVGANIGYTTAWLLSLTGKDGEVHSFEPVDHYYKRLVDIKELNPDYNLHLNKVALGESESIAEISVSNDDNIGWNSMVPGMMQNQELASRQETQVTPLGDYLSRNHVKSVRLIKIDVEGYEFPVMLGCQEYLKSLEELPYMVIEICPSAHAYIGTSLKDFSALMRTIGYDAMELDMKTPVDVEGLKTTKDVVFVPANRTT